MSAREPPTVKVVQSFGIKVHLGLVQLVIEGLRQSTVIFSCIETFCPAIPGCLTSLGLQRFWRVDQQSTHLASGQIGAVPGRK